MMPELVCSVRYEPPLALVRVDGALTVRTASRIRATVLKCLAERPSAVIVEIDSMDVANDVALTVFLAVARHAAAWPGIPILLCTGRPGQTHLLRRLGIDRQAILCVTVEQARACAAEQPLPRQVRDRLQPVPESAATARRLVADACRRWSLGSLTPVAGVVVNELVSNAVVHAGTAIDLTVSYWGSQLHLAVRDYDPRRPRLTGPAGETEPGGRGLLLVEAMATTWGYTPTADGKVTWASLSTLASGEGLSPGHAGGSPPATSNG